MSASHLELPDPPTADAASTATPAGHPSENRRAHVRLDPSELDWLLGARIKYDREIRVLDLSAGGIRIETERELAADSSLILELAHADGPIVVPARVVRCEPDASGRPGRFQCACVFRRPLNRPELLDAQKPAAIAATLRGRVAVMPRPEAGPGWQKVVVRYLDGRLLRGFTSTFHPSKPLLHLSPDPQSPQTQPVQMTALKALFFVREFEGDATLVEEKTCAGAASGRKVEVTFHDGEVLVGTTLGYRGKDTGFFVFPADDRSNNLRIFVTPAGTRGVRFL